MVALTKAKDISAFLNNPSFERKVILLFGPDQGLVNERATLLAAKSGVDLNDPFSVIRLDADDAASDRARIADEAHTVGMFGGQRLIWISGTTRRDLGKAVKPVLDTPAQDALILIEAGDLKKNSGLRGQLERSKNAICIACYQDTDAALDQLINEEIVNAGLKIEPSTRRELKALLGENRMVSRGELAKLALYCHGRETVGLEDVHKLVGDAAKTVVDEIVDAVALGETDRLQDKLPRAIEAGNAPDMILLFVLRHFQIMQSLRSTMQTKRQSAASLVGALRPPVHFSRKDQVVRAISIWPVERITRALLRLDRTLYDCRKTADLAPSLAGTALLALALEARRLGERR